MNTTQATPIPDCADDRPPFNVKRQLWRLPIGEIFQDAGGQRFEKIAEIINRCGEPRHAIQCLASPFKRQPGPIASAFFTTPGTILFREGWLKVFVRG
jgi:hypothetical protein